MWLCRLLVVSVTVAALSGCGFHPLYAPPSDDSDSMARDLSTVRVAPIADRYGQVLREDLIRRLAPEGTADKTTYVLNVELKETTNNVALERTGLGSRAQVRMEATYKLVDERTGNVTLQGRSRAVESFNLGDSEFSVVVSAQDARNRTVDRIASDIRARLGAYFADAPDS